MRIHYTNNTRIISFCEAIFLKKEQLIDIVIFRLLSKYALVLQSCYNLDETTSWMCINHYSLLATYLIHKQEESWMKKVYSLLLCGILFIAVLSACSSASAPANPSNETDQETNTTTDNTNEATPTTPATTDTESSDTSTESSAATDSSTGTTKPATENSESSTTSTGSIEQKGPIAADSVEKRPTYLPTDFPIPDDAVISTSHQEENDGKKSVLLMFTTKGSMETLSQTYKQYFDAKSLTNAGSTIDEKNLIIQGTDPKTKQVWSLIGSPQAGKDVVQLTLTWSEK